MVNLKLRDWSEVINQNFPSIEVTEKTVKNSVRMAQRGYRTDARVATRRVYTDAEYEYRRNIVLNTPLP